MLLPFFEWCETLCLGQFVVGSNWLFPVIEVVHLIGLAGLGGAILLVDLRLLDLGLRDVPVASLARSARPWLRRSLAATIVSGVALFLSEAVKCFENPAFWLKLGCLAVALLFAGLIRSRYIDQHATRASRLGARLAGATSIVL